jgi:hypothetical protein
MRSLNKRAPRIAGLLALALGAVALLAVSGVAAAKDRSANDHGGNHGRDHNHGRHHDHQFEMRESGTITSFDASTGKLTIALLGSGTVTGLVTEGTEIKCEGIDNRLGRRDQGGGGDNSGPGTSGGQNQSGDDEGGDGNEPGDDNGGQNEPGDDNGGEEMPPVGTPEGEASCSVASLVPGAVVGEAELRVEGGSTVFEEIELGQHS